MNASMPSSAPSDEEVSLQNRYATLMGITLTFLIFSCLCVAARLYVRFRVVKSPGWDDVFVFLSIICGAGSSIANLISSNNELMGHHAYEITNRGFEWFELFLKCYWISFAFWQSSTTFIKLAFLFQYLRMRRTGLIRWLCILLIVLVSTNGIVFCLNAWFPCVPIDNFLHGTGQHCWGMGSPSQIQPFMVLGNALNMFFDLTILIIPVLLYFRKDTSKRTMLGLLVILSMGVFVNIIAGWRLYTNAVYQNGSGNHAHRKRAWSNFDITFNIPMFALQADLENKLSIICASIPVFWPVITSTFGKIFVTHEVHVEHSDLYEDAAVSEDGTDAAFFCVGKHSGAPSESSESSDTAFKQVSKEEAINSHYQNKFVAAQVNCWDNSAPVESATVVTIQGPGQA